MTGGAEGETYKEKNEEKERKKNEKGKEGVREVHVRREKIRRQEQRGRNEGLTRGKEKGTRYTR